MCCTTWIARTLVAATASIAVLTPAAFAADPQALCHKTVVKQLEKFKKTVLKAHSKCIDKENKLVIPGPCPDAATNLKIATINSKVKAKIVDKCLLFADLLALGYRNDCNYGPGTLGVDGTCAALPVTTVDEFAECMKCWKEADFRRYLAILYASHAVEQCGALDGTSATCSDLGCATPLPEQRNLGDNSEGDCQKRIGKAGVKYLLKREKIFEKCMLKGCDKPTCLSGGCALDLTVPVKLEKAELQKKTAIEDKCGGNRVPSLTSNFCCRSGTGNACVSAADRAACESAGGTVQEGKTCGVDDTCTQAPKTITWWASCPSEPGACPGTAVATIADLIACVDSTADGIVDDLLCMQFPNGNACPTPTSAPTPTPTPTP